MSIRNKPVAPIVAKLADAFADSTLKVGMQSLTVESALRGEIGATVPAEFLDAGNQMRKVEIPLREPAGAAAQFGNLPTFHVRYISKRLPSNIGYVSLSA